MKSRNAVMNVEGEPKAKADIAAEESKSAPSSDEIAKAVSFLASNEASYVAGTELYVDAGMAQI